MSAGPLGYYRPGSTILHRMPAGVKLMSLFVVALLLVIFRGALSTSIVLVLVIVLTIESRVGIKDILKLMRGFWLLLIILFAFHVWQSGALHAYVVVGALVALIVAANLITVTTSTQALLDTLTRVLRPFKIFGVNPEAVAFAVSLTLRTIPMIFYVARETRDAAKARGLERSPRALLIPLLIRTIKHADNLGDALNARGLP